MGKTNESLSPPRALVTGSCALVSGATGFLGHHLLEYLKQAGFRVRVLVRPGRMNPDLPMPDGIEIVSGELEDENSLKRAVAGQHTVFHTAGKVGDWGRRRDFFRVNADGSARLARICRKASVRRLIHISSLTVLGLPRNGATVNEDTAVLAHPKDPYSASKLMAEQLMQAAHDPMGMGVTIIRPGVIWGKGDVTILPRIVKLLNQRRMVAIDGGRNILGLSHVDNLCPGIIQAALCPRAAGQTYHLTDGEEISARQAIETVAQAMGLPGPTISLPFPLIYGAAALMEGVTRIRRSQTPPLITRYAVRLLACNNRYDIGKARRELGYAPGKTFAEGIGEMNLNPEAT